jgi:hypothetical protein
MSDDPSKNTRERENRIRNRAYDLWKLPAVLRGANKNSGSRQKP